MKSLLIVLLIVLQLAQACHPSCNCDPYSNICKSCVDPNSQIDQNTERSCPCNPGWYTSQTSPFQCKYIINTNFEGNNIEQTLTYCQKEIGLKTKNLLIYTRCHFENSSDSSYVISSVQLDLTSISLNNECYSEFQTEVDWYNINDQQWYQVPEGYIIKGVNGSKTMKWPLMEIYNIKSQQTINDQQISQIVNLRIKIGHQRKYVRIHSWNLFVFTNRNQVQTFQIDVDLQRTTGCQPGQECVIVADLMTEGNVFTDENYNIVQDANHLYEVGKKWYARIKFTDSTYKKQLSFQNLFFKNDNNNILDYSHLVTANWDGSGLRVSFPLIEPSMIAYIQINMLIETANSRRLRSLQTSSESISQQFQATILSGNLDLKQPTSTNSTNNNSLLIILNIFNFLFIFLWSF